MWIFRVLCLPVALLISKGALAAQNLYIDGQATATAKISAREPSRIAVHGGRIQEIYGANGKAEITTDDDAGEVYLRPTNAYLDRPFSIFVKDSEGRVAKLLLQPQEVPAEIVIIHHESRDAKAVTSDGNYQVALAWEKNHPYEQSIVELIKMMVMRQLPEGYGHTFVGRDVRLWQEAELKYVALYQGASLRGEHYTLKNVSDSEMRLAEQEFARAGVVAVAIDRHELASQETTDIYIVTRVQ